MFSVCQCPWCWWVGINCGNLSVYLNAINCFKELKRDLTVLCFLDQNIVVIVSAQPALTKAEKLTARYSKLSLKIHLPFLPKPRKLKAN